MSNTLTITEHEKIKVTDRRDIKSKIISKRDGALLLDITHKTRAGKTIKVFSTDGKIIKANSIVGSISLKSGLIIEILPKFAKGNLEEESIKKHRIILLNMIRVSKEKNFISSTTQSSKVSVGEMPLIRYMIELFSESLLITLRNSTFSHYTKTIENSSYIKGNLLISKTIQNNIIDKSKVYVTYNKHSMNNILMQVFRTLSKILLNDTNLSYRAKQNLYEVYLLLDNVQIINLKQHDFTKITFNRLNNKFEDLFKQAEFIFNQYMPFTSNINSTPFWAILFNMDYLFEKFCAYLFRRSNIEIDEQSKIDCYTDNIKTVTMKPDFLLFENDKIVSVVDAKWKLLQSSKNLYGLITGDFYQLLAYMNFTTQDSVLNGYFIVPKHGNDFEDEVTFKPIQNGKEITILSIDFSLEFEELIEKYQFILENGSLKLDLHEKVDLVVEEKKEDIIDLINIGKEEFQFNLENFIKELETLHNNKNIRKRLSPSKKDDKFKNLYYLKENYNANSSAFKNSVKENLLKSSWDFTGLEIDLIPFNIIKLKNIQSLNLSSNRIKNIPVELFRLKKLLVLDISNNYLKILPKEILGLKNLKKIILDRKIVKENIEILERLKNQNIKIEDAENNDLYEYINSFIASKVKEKEIINEVEPIQKNILTITIKNYSNMIKEEKISFVNDIDLYSISQDVITLIMQETDIDILEDFTYNQTLPLRFAFATYNNNLERVSSEINLLKENLLNRNNKILTLLVNSNFESQYLYVEKNFYKIDKDIILGYSMSSLNQFYKIREMISKNSDDLDILNELSKHRKDRPILKNIIFKTSNNDVFTKKIKNHKTIYSTEILNRIAHYDEHSSLQKLLLNNYNIIDKTREYLETRVEKQEQDYSEYIDEPFNQISNKWEK